MYVGGGYGSDLILSLFLFVVFEWLCAAGVCVLLCCWSMCVVLFCAMCEVCVVVLLLYVLLCCCCMSALVS